MKTLFGIPVVESDRIPGDMVIVTKHGIDVIRVAELLAAARRKALEEAIEACILTMNDTDYGYVCLKVEKRIRAIIDNEPKDGE